MITRCVVDGCDARAVVAITVRDAATVASCPVHAGLVIRQLKELYPDARGITTRSIRR